MKGVISLHTYPDLSKKNIWKDECKRYAACLIVSILTLAGIGCFASVFSHIFF